MGDRFQVISESEVSKIIDMQERRVVATFAGRHMAKAAFDTAQRLNETRESALRNLERIREIEFSDDSE